MRPTSPTLFYDIAEEALAAVVDGLNTVLPPEHRHDMAVVVNGPPALDDWDGCARAVTAWLEFVTPSTTPPNPAAGVVICTPPWPMVQVVVQTIRCEPTIDQQAHLPPAVDLDAAARLVAVDAFVAWNALALWAVAKYQADEDDWSVAMGLSQAVPPAGGLVGWETRVVVTPTAPSCPLNQLAEVGPEWWPAPPAVAT